MPRELADRLTAAPAVRAAREALSGRDDAWIVGGAIRDAALGREVVDADLAVAAEEREAARAIARTAGGPAFELSAEFGTWRVEAPGRDWHIDVTRLRAADIEGDLALRDFTVNSVALPLDDLGATPIDPTGGLEDLGEHRLRATSQRAFADDPLRILRAARLACALELELDPRTLQWARAAADRAAEPAGERQLGELRQLVAAADPVRGLALLDELGATPAVLPELAALRGVEQNPNHHLDVYGHTIEVLENLLEVERDLDRYAGAAANAVRELLDEPLADGFDRRSALRLGAVFHDAGKPATRKLRNGYVTFIGHDREGAVIARAACERLKASRALCRHLGALALHHLHLGFMAAERPLPCRCLHWYLRTTAPVAADVTLLTVADRLSARGSGPTASPEMIEAHLALAREVLGPAIEWHRSGGPRSPVPGDELAAALGAEPGPELGRLISELEAATFCGEVEGPEDAIEFARRILNR